MKLAYSIRILTVLTFLLYCLDSNAQLNCTSKISYEVNAVNSTGTNGSISVNVATAGNFDLILSTVSGRGTREVQAIRNSTQRNVTFDNLEGGHIYELFAIFYTEEGLCRKRIASGITIDNL